MALTARERLRRLAPRLCARYTMASSLSCRQAVSPAPPGPDSGQRGRAAQPIYPVVRERKALQAGAASASAPARGGSSCPQPASATLRSCGFPRQHRHWILVRQPFVTRRQRQLLQPLGVPQQPGQCGPRDLRTTCGQGEAPRLSAVPGEDSAYSPLRSSFLAAGCPPGLGTCHSGRDLRPQVDPGIPPLKVLLAGWMDRFQGIPSGPRAIRKGRQRGWGLGQGRSGGGAVSEKGGAPAPGSPRRRRSGAARARCSCTSARKARLTRCSQSSWRSGTQLQDVWEQHVFPGQIRSLWVKGRWRRRPRVLLPASPPPLCS